MTRVNELHREWLKDPAYAHDLAALAAFRPARRRTNDVPVAARDVIPAAPKRRGAKSDFLPASAGRA